MKNTTYASRKEAARQKAIEWQSSFTDNTYSYGELLEFQAKFERLARRYGLLREFRENCIC